MGFRKPFRAPPLRGRNHKVVPFRKARPKSVSWTGFSIIAVSTFLIGFGLTLRFGLPFADGMPFTGGDGASSPQHFAHASASDTLSASFGNCDGPQRVNCVVDGDTFWFAGDKIRILDINTPEISSPQCDREYQLGMQATQRLTELLNEGPFSLESDGRDTDRYGRLLRRVTRGGQSLGQVLVAEGLAEEWKGYKGNWC